MCTLYFFTIPKFVFLFEVSLQDFQVVQPFFERYDLGTESLPNYARIYFFTKMKINAK